MDRPSERADEPRSPDTAAPLPQLTVRATCLGALLGLVTGVSNLYIGLKTGLALGVVVTAGVLGWALWSVLLRLRLARRPLGVLETCSLATTASAAGYSTGVLLTSAVSAHAMLTGAHMAWWRLSLWVTSVALLGALLGMLLRRTLLDDEALPFPTGVAAAETLRSLGGGEAPDALRARALWIALAVGAALKWLTSGAAAVGAWSLPPQLPTAAMVAGVPWLAGLIASTWSLELSAAIVGTGAMIGWHMCWSTMLGALLCFGVAAPIGHEMDFIAALEYRAIVAWSVWPGVAWMIVGGLGQLLRGWAAARRRGAAWTLRPRPLLAVAAAGSLCIVLQRQWFAVPLAVAALAVLVAGVLAMITARVAGETDVVLAGPFAKVAQVGCGGLLPGAPGPALTGASVTAGAASACAALLTDLKVGRLLGADMRRQFAAHLIGVLLGGALLVPVFVRVLVPDPAALGTATWPAPAAQAWRSIAEVLAGGSTLAPAIVLAIGVAALAGALLLALAHWRPRLAPWLPHPMGLGLGFIVPAYHSVTFFVGGLTALLLARRYPRIHGRYLLLIAAGLVAGESLLGVVIALLEAQG